MFGTSKDKKILAALVPIVAKMLELDADATAQEVLTAAEDWEAEQEAAVKADDEKEAKPAKEGKKAETTEGAKADEKADGKAAEAAAEPTNAEILAEVRNIGNRVGALEKLPYRAATTGRRDAEKESGKTKYSADQAPKFVD